MDTTEEEKKPIEGNEFVRRAAQSIIKKQTGSPAASATEEDEVAALRKKTKVVQAQHELVSTVETLQNPPGLQQIREERQRELEEEARHAREQTENFHNREMARLQTEREEALTQAQAADGKRQEAERSLQTQQTQMLLEKLEELKKSNKPMEEQLDAYLAYAERIAGKMGFQKADGRPPGDNPQITLEIKKLELEAAERDRQWQWQMAEANRAWDMKIIELQDNRAFRKQELDQRAKRDEALFSLPQAIGGAVAKGLIDREEHATSGSITRTPQQSRSFRLEVGEGESGEAECPNCHSAVGVGPTSTVAQCVGCNSEFAVTRVPPPGVPTKPSPQETSQYEEE